MKQSKTGLAALLGQQLMVPQGLPMGPFSVGPAEGGRNVWQGNRFLMGAGPAIANQILQPLPAFDPPSINPDPGENPLPPGEVDPVPQPTPIPPQEPAPAPLPSPVPVPQPESPNPQPLPPPVIPPMPPQGPQPIIPPGGGQAFSQPINSRQQAGLLAPPDYSAMDMRGLAQAMQQLLSSPLMRQSLALGF